MSGLTRAITTSVVATLLVVALLEVAARWFVAPVQPKVPRIAAAVPADVPILDSWFDLGVPNQRGLYKGVLYETNRAGLRSPDLPLEKPWGTHRIAVLGDSFVMGERVEAEDSYVRRLEQELPKLRPGRYETINCGLSGLNADVAGKRYVHAGLQYDPDVAVYGFTLNDIEGPRYKKLGTPTRDPYGVENPRLALLRLIGPGWVAFREAYWPSENSYTREIRYNYFHNPEAWSDFVEALERLAAGNEARGICSVLFVHTQLVTLNVLHPFKSIYEKVAEAAELRGYTTIQSLPMHLGRRGRDLWVDDFDSHPNAEGHRLLALALARGLAELPESCW